MLVSVIICTHNRSSALPSCLDALAKAIRNTPQVDSQILIVNNNCSDDTEQVIDGWAAANPDIDLVVKFETRKGLSFARNCGLSNAPGDLLLMIDDDCHADENYINQALDYDRNDTSLVLRGGSVKLGDPTDQPLTIKSTSKKEVWSKALNSARHDNLGNSLLGCNMMMRRELAEAIGAFDVNLGAGTAIPGGEDTDYILRSYLAGYPIEFVPDMCVWHFHGRKKTQDGYNLLRNYSIGGGALCAKYIFKNPSMCRQLYWDIKKLPKEWISRKSLFLDEFGFTMTDKVRFYFYGMYLYWRTPKAA